jgi:hypothetical protein
VRTPFRRESNLPSDARTRALPLELSRAHSELTTLVIEPGMANKILLGFRAAPPVIYQWCGVARIRNYEPIDANTGTREKLNQYNNKFAFG